MHVKVDYSKIDKRLKKCKKCGFCCTADSFYHDRVDIKPSDIERWKRMKIWHKVKSKLETTSENETGFIISLDGKNCGFLDKDNLCSLQKRYGYYAKPMMCRKFNCASESE